MILNFCLFKYFPFGGMQRDCLRLAQACKSAGFTINILTMHWEGPKPKDLNIIEFPQKSFFNYKKYIKFNNQVVKFIQQNDIKNNIKSLTIGFNKMHGLDIYYAADGCFMTKNIHKAKYLGLTGRFKYFKSMEHAVFNNDSLNRTKILFLIDKQKEIYKNYYNTDSSRLYVMPPVIEIIDKIRALNDKKIEKPKPESSSKLRFLLIGSGFKTKGLDRILLGLSFIKDKGQKNFELLVVGNDKSSSFDSLIKKLDLQDNIVFTGGRSDVAELMQSADLLLHPAYHENTGKVIIEAIASGLPVICTAECGFSKYVTESNSGIVLEEFAQEEFNQSLYLLIKDKDKRLKYAINGERYGIKFQKDSDSQKLLEVIKTF